MHLAQCLEAMGAFTQDGITEYLGFLWVSPLMAQMAHFRWVSACTIPNQELADRLKRGFTLKWWISARQHETNLPVHFESSCVMHCYIPNDSKINKVDAVKAMHSSKQFVFECYS